MECDSNKINVVLLTNRSNLLCKEIILSSIDITNRVENIFLTVAYGGFDEVFKSWLTEVRSYKYFRTVIDTDFLPRLLEATALPSEWVLFISDDDPFTVNYIQEVVNTCRLADKDARIVAPCYYLSITNGVGTVHKTISLTDDEPSKRYKHLIENPLFSGLGYYAAHRYATVAHWIKFLAGLSWLPSYSDQLLVTLGATSGKVLVAGSLTAIVRDETNWGSLEACFRSDSRAYTPPTLTLYHELFWIRDMAAILNEQFYKNEFTIRFHEWAKSLLLRNIEWFIPRCQVLGLVNQKHIIEYTAAVHSVVLNISSSKDSDLVGKYQNKTGWLLQIDLIISAVISLNNCNLITDSNKNLLPNRWLNCLNKITIQNTLRRIEIPQSPLREFSTASTETEIITESPVSDIAKAIIAEADGLLENEDLPGAHRLILTAFRNNASDDTLRNIAAETTRMARETYPLPNFSGHVQRRRINVAVLTYNALESTQLFLQSLKRFASESYNIFVVDNGSTDGTREWFSQLTDDNVFVEFSPVNYGVPGGRNRLIQMIAPFLDEDAYVVFCDNDLEMTADWMEPFFRLFQLVPDCGMAGRVGHEIVIQNHSRHLLPCPTIAAPVDVVSGGYACWIKAQVIQAVGLFDEKLGLFWHEDDDYSLRAIAAGFEVFVVPNAPVLHHEHKSGEASDGIAEGGSRAHQAYLVEKWHKLGYITASGRIYHPNRALLTQLARRTTVEL